MAEIINAFPGYKWEQGKDGKMHNMYRGTDLGRGGYVYSEPGIYSNVVLLDVASLHPHSAIGMNYFGEYTQRYKDILDARMFIKHGDFESARKMLDGKLAPYLDDESTAKQLAQALKIAINSVYGLTSAGFDNPFKDSRNVNNIVALKGALFMRTLQDEVTKRGYKVCHIKTDSIKIPDGDSEIIDFCMEFANQYGYTFEHEATYDRMCLINDADYIAMIKNGDENIWTATGKRFSIPYVYKSLFTHEDLVFEDLCWTFEVKTALYLNMGSDNPEDYRFIGKVGEFCPMPEGIGGELLRVGSDGEKYSAATGSKGYFWLESEVVKANNLEGKIWTDYFEHLVDDAKAQISKYGDFDWFVDPENDISIPI